MAQIKTIQKASDFPETLEKGADKYRAGIKRRNQEHREAVRMKIRKNRAKRKAMSTK